MVEIESWLQSLGLSQYVDLFAQHHIDADLLSDLNHDALEAIGVTSIGHRLRIIKSIALLDPAEVETKENHTSIPQDDSVFAESTERRQLTVMFCDLVGSTALSQGLDPEDYRQIILRYRSAITAPIEYYNGFVAEFLGDGVLVYFGYPRAGEDDAARALRAGLDIIDAVDHLNIDLKVRIGIATGLVVTGLSLKGDQTPKHDAMGNTANLAARLQSIAASGTIVVTDLTRRLAKTGFAYRSLGSKSLKGLPELIDVYQVVRRRRSNPKYGERIDGAAELVGRDSLVEEMMSLWREAIGGSGKLMLLDGEPGIGKSRIVQELYLLIPKRRRATLQFFGSPQHTSSAFFPIVDHIENMARFSMTDSLDEKLGKFRKTLSNIVDDTSHAAPLLEILLALPHKKHKPVRVTAEEQKREWILRFSEQIEVLSQKRPVLMIVEDVHWIDPTTLSVLNEVIQKIKTLPVLIVITHRPGFKHTWHDLDYVVLRTLGELDRSDGLRIVRQLSTGDQVADDLKQQIIDQTDGVPLFIEELTKWIIESDISQDEDSDSRRLVIPETLQDLLMSRLDRLDAAKEIAQLAAVIGRQFSFKLLATLTGRNHTELRHALQKLIDTGLVASTEVTPTSEFSFRHALIQEAAYRSLLNSSRRLVHAQIGETLERSFPEVAEADPGLIAHHFELGHQPAKAIDYRIRASKREMRQLASIESIQQLEWALQTLKGLPEGRSRNSLEIDIQIRVGRSWIPLKGYGAIEVWRSYERARKIAEQSDDKSRLLETLFGLAAYYHHQAELQKAYEIGEQCLELAARSTDVPSRIKTCVSQGLVLFHLGELSRAKDLLDDGALMSEINSHENSSSLQHPGVVCHAYGGLAHWLCGSLDTGRSKIDDAIALALKVNSLYSLVYALCVDLSLRQSSKAGPEYLVQADRAIDAAQKGKFEFWESIAKYFRDWYLSVKNKDEDAVKRMLETQRHWNKVGMKFSQPHYHFCVANGLAAVGRTTEAMATIEQAISLCNSSFDQVYQAEIYRLRGDILLREGATNATPKAYSDYQRAETLAEKQGAIMWQLRALSAMKEIAQNEQQHQYIEKKLGAASRLLPKDQIEFSINTVKSVFG